MLADPVSITAAAPTPALAFAIASVNGQSTRRVDTGGNPYTVYINHTSGKGGDKHYLQVIQTVNATNPYTGLVEQKQASCSLTINRPSFGFTDAAMVALCKLLTDFRDDDQVGTLKLLQFQS